MSRADYEPWTAETPVDVLEPLEAESWRRQCARQALQIVFLALQHIRSPYHGPEVGVVSLEFALDMRSDSMAEAAQALGVTVATISHATNQACLALGLTPSRSMRSASARDAYSSTAKKYARDKRNNRHGSVGAADC
jgi:hypothetical protein